MKKKILSLLIASAMMLGTAAFAIDTEENANSEATAEETVIGGTNESTEIAVTSSDEEEEQNANITADDAAVASPETASEPGAKQVSVYVNNTLMLFNDQQPVIKDDFTLVPVRGVFEAMDNRVKWNGENRTVTISSRNNLTRIILTIDNKTMTVYHFTSIMSADENKITLDVAPQIMNDRTMIPLRAISEALGTDVGWNGEKYEVHITTPNFSTDTESKMSLSLKADKTEIKAGEEVTLSAVISNLKLYPETYVSAITASVSYDKDNFEFTEAYMCDAEGNDLGAMGASNPNYTSDSLKTVYVTINEDVAMSADGAILKIVFKAKNDAESNFALVDRYNSKLGNDITLLLGYPENNKTKMIEGTDLVIDTTPITVNASKTAATETNTASYSEEVILNEDTAMNNGEISEETKEIIEETEEIIEETVPEDEEITSAEESGDEE